MARSRVAFLVVVALVLFCAGALARGPAATPMAAAGERDAYPHLIGQEHVGSRCSPDDAALAGGTIVGVGGQVVAGGGGTGVGCDTFWAYELRTGEPTTRHPFAEPAVYLNPGAASPA
jgi:hypothetical protein